ncbi:hypothetical protein GCM10029978_043060 [Actinoallomurus acanthiterrae]
MENSSSRWSTKTRVAVSGTGSGGLWDMVGSFCHEQSDHHLRASPPPKCDIPDCDMPQAGVPVIDSPRSGA